MQRTQIYLPDNLRKEIDKHIASSGESLAEYLREAAVARLKREKKEKIDLKKLAEDFIGSSKMSREEAKQWIQAVRDDRRLSDERLEKRWQQVLKKRSK